MQWLFARDHSRAPLLRFLFCFGFFKAEAVSTAGIDKSWYKAGSKLRWTWVSHSSRIPPNIRAKFWGWEGKCDLPVALSSSPTNLGSGHAPCHSWLLQSPRTQGKPSPGQGERHWGQLERQDIPHPTESFAKLLSRALLHKSYLTSQAEFPCRHSAFPWASWGMPGLICNGLSANRHHTWISRILPQTRQATPRRPCLFSGTHCSHCWQDREGNYKPRIPNSSDTSKPQDNNNANNRIKLLRNKCCISVFSYCHSGSKISSCFLKEKTQTTRREKTGSDWVKNRQSEQRQNLCQNAQRELLPVSQEGRDGAEHRKTQT